MSDKAAHSLAEELSIVAQSEEPLFAEAWDMLRPADRKALLREIYKMEKDCITNSLIPNDGCLVVQQAEWDRMEAELADLRREAEGALPEHISSDIEEAAWRRQNGDEAEAAHLMNRVFDEVARHGNL